MSEDPVSPPVLDLPTATLLRLAATIAAGDEPALWSAVDAAAAEVPMAWVDELMLQSTLIVGWPRALTAVARWRKVIGTPAIDPAQGEDYAGWEAWESRGEAVCGEVYGATYPLLRESVRKLHPALDRWMIVEAYGRTLSRPGLDLRRRELCTVVQTAVLNTPRQLHSHLRGALHAGASVAEIGAALVLAEPFVPEDARQAVLERWDHVRERWSMAS